MTFSTTDPLLADLKRRDPERFASLLFVPAPSRFRIALLYSFNLELASVREKALREAMAGHIRLQWWRDSLEGSAQGNAFTSQLLDLKLPLAMLLSMIDAREADLSPEAPSDMAALEGYASATGGALHALAATLLGGNDREVEIASKAGSAYALQGLMRAIPAHAAWGRRHLPLDLWAGEIKGPSSLLNRAVESVALQAGTYLDGVDLSALRKTCRPAALCALPARTHLKRLRRSGFDPFDGRLALPATRPMAMLLAML